MKRFAVPFSVALYDGIALLLLFQWHSSPHWVRLDIYSGFYLAISTALAVQQVLFAGRLSSSSEFKDLFFAKRIHPAWNKSVGVLGLLELAVFFDYGHLHTARSLELPWLQWAGLILDLMSFGWLLWVDRYLLKNFVRQFEAKAPMMSALTPWFDIPVTRAWWERA